MAKDREIVCINYEALGKCKKGREARHEGYCQRCDKYYPRARVKLLNKKKLKLNSIIKREGLNRNDYC